jgi:hypothetical protein
MKGRADPHLAPTEGNSAMSRTQKAPSPSSALAMLPRRAHYTTLSFEPAHAASRVSLAAALKLLPSNT